MELDKKINKQLPSFPRKLILARFSSLYTSCLSQNLYPKKPRKFNSKFQCLHSLFTIDKIALSSSCLTAVVSYKLTRCFWKNPLIHSILVEETTYCDSQIFFVAVSFCNCCGSQRSSIPGGFVRLLLVYWNEGFV